MPIRFPCQQCGAPLSIARRKVGASIDCPKCGHAQIVPSEETAESAALAAMANEEEEPDGDEPEAIILVEVPPGTDTLVVAVPTTVVGAASPVADGGRVVAGDEAGHPVDDEPAHPSDRVVGEMVLVSRHAIYVQGALIAAVGIVALLIGYLVGHGVAPRDAVDEGNAVEVEQVVVEGRLLYRPGDRIEGDENAVALFLPHDRQPNSRIETPGIRPEDSPSPGYTSLQKIHELGGAYARADAGGEFLVNLPRTGVYYVLLISSNARRPDGATVRETDLATLDAYFRRPEYLIGSQKYRLTVVTLSGFAPIEHDFGLDRR
ncbi:MAG TPA: hypothetical protein DD670_06895 [Planctomycetaceae bacterium]|nr:hypothetical protein [Planctomycetaceae bacterium]